jgi:hypothetical protein
MPVARAIRVRPPPESSHPNSCPAEWREEGAPARNITDADPQEWQGSTTSCCAASPSATTWKENSGGRAATERAKGILMERHSVDEPAAFKMLRDYSRAANRKLVDIAAAVVDGHPLLPKPNEAPP